MSDDQLDKEFKARVKQVFDNYEDDSGAEGWALLREKFPEKDSNRTVVLLWRYIGAAAILLAILSVALWFNKKPEGNNVIVKNNTNKTAAPVKIAATVPDKNVNLDSNKVKTNIAYQSPVKPANTTNDAVSSSAAQTGAVNKLQAHNSLKPGAVNTASLTANNSTVVKPAANSQQNVTGNTQNIVAVNKPLNNNPTQALNGNNPNTAAVSNQTNAKTPANTTGNNSQTVAVVTQVPVSNNSLLTGVNDTSKNRRIIATTSDTKPTKTTGTTAPKRAGMEALFANDNKYNTAQNNHSDVKVKDRKIVFGVYAATYVNYAKGSNNQFNTGAGISTDIKLTENLSILTGVSIAQNSFTYNDISASSPVMFPAAISHEFSASNALTLAQVVPPSRNLDANLVGLDVPVDLKYMFNPQRSSAYVSAGFSSGAFINETYNYTYNYSVDNSPTNQETQGATARRSFNDFYFAKMLNVAFGIGYPLGKGNQLIVEPFLKYPINGLGDQHILFGSGGLNLKLNFDSPKSKR